MTDNTAVDLYLTGLKNAHALEKQALSMMQPQINRIENYPDVLQRMQEHARETEVQIQRLDSLLDQLGDSPSALKEVATQITGALGPITHSFSDDEILKNTFANAAFENFEIASYRSLITLAEASGNSAHVSVLQQTLAEEVAMAEWIQSNVGPVTQRYLALKQGGLTAKS
jgi:ferritin-like metal-binding protein YciE